MNCPRLSGYSTAAPWQFVGGHNHVSGVGTRVLLDS
jgi:hypothetical protein